MTDTPISLAEWREWANAPELHLTTPGRRVAAAVLALVEAVSAAQDERAARIAMEHTLRNDPRLYAERRARWSAAGKRLAAALSRFVSEQTPNGKSEKPVADETSARAQVSVKPKLWINRAAFEGHGVAARMTGRDLRRLPAPIITDAYDLWHVVPGHDDELVSDDDVIEIANAHGGSGYARFFSTPKIINAGSGPAVRPPGNPE